MSNLKRFSSILCSFLFVSLITFIHDVTSTTTGCRANRFREAIGTNENDDYLIYGITQDCQLFFVRSYQLDYLNSIQVDPRNGYCSPGVVQLHISSASTILLLMRQGPSRLCTLELSIPPPEIIFGAHVFKFSVVTSLRFMVCSHAQDFHLDPAQTFLDTAFQDVIYAIDGESRGSQWMAKQLVMRNGTLRLLGSVAFDHYPTDPKEADAKMEAKEFVLGRDSARKSLIVVDQHTRAYTKSCLFDLLFRPHAVKVEHGKIENPFGGGATLHSVSTDGHIMVIGEEKRAGQYTTSTFVYAMNSSLTPSRMNCIAQMDFAAEVGMIRISTLKQMRDEPLPKFSPHKKKDFHRRISEEFDDEKSIERKEKERDREMNRVKAIGDETTREIQEKHQMEDQKESEDEFSVETVDHNKDTDEDEEPGEMKEREEHKNERHHHQKHHDHTSTTNRPTPNDLPRNAEKPTGISPNDPADLNSISQFGSPTNDTLTSSSRSLSILFSCASISFSAFLVLLLN